MTSARRALLLVALAAGCGGGALVPVPLDTRTEHCRSCQMPVSDIHTAAQIVAPGDEPVFFDDLACLATYAGRGALPAGAVAFVADHRSGQWVEARAAVFSEVTGLATPMASGLVAHVDARARAEDLASREYRDVERTRVLGAARGAGDVR
jgi:copper chaperone NosL